MHISRPPFQRLSVWGWNLEIFVLFYFILSLGPHLWHMEISRLGVQSELSYWPTAQPQQHQIQGASVTYTTAHSNARSLTH